MDYIQPQKAVLKRRKDAFSSASFAKSRGFLADGPTFACSLHIENALVARFHVSNCFFVYGHKSFLALLFVGQIHVLDFVPPARCPHQPCEGEHGHLERKVLTSENKVKTTYMEPISPSPEYTRASWI